MFNFDLRPVYTCKNCGSEEVCFDAVVYPNLDVTHLLDDQTCNACGYNGHSVLQRNYPSDEHLVHWMLREGCSISVDDGGVHLALIDSRNAEAVIDAMQAVDEARLRIRLGGNNVVAAYIIYGNGPHELVADHSAHPIFDEWQAAYDKLNESLDTQGDDDGLS